MELQPHLLAIPCPAQGHIIPMFQLCRELASTGLFITFLVPMKNNTIFGTTDLDSNNFRLVFFPDEFVQERFTVTSKPSEFLSILEEALDAVVPQMIQETMESETVPRLTCILTDGLLLSPRGIAHKFNLVKASLCTFPASWICIHRSLQLLQDKISLPVKRSGSEMVVDFIPGLPPVSTKHLPLHIQQLEQGSSDLQRRRRTNDMLETDDWVFLNTFHELEASQLDEISKKTPNFVPVGPLVPFSAFHGEADCKDRIRPGLWKEELNCLDWLDEQPVKSVVYVSFGSLARLSYDQAREIFSGLEGSGQPYLWVARSDMVNDNGCQLEDLLKHSQRGKFVSWSPQLKVLKHPSVALFLTHCGWNSVIEALVTGVPILTWPCVYEQPLNSALAVEYWKIGIPLSQAPGLVVRAEDIEKAIRDMVIGDQGRRCRENILELSLAARNAVSETGASKRNLQAFVHDLKRRSNELGRSS